MTYIQMFLCNPQTARVERSLGPFVGAARASAAVANAYDAEVATDLFSVATASLGAFSTAKHTANLSPVGRYREYLGCSERLSAAVRSFTQDAKNNLERLSDEQREILKVTVGASSRVWCEASATIDHLCTAAQEEIESLMQKLARTANLLISQADGSCRLKQGPSGNGELIKNTLFFQFLQHHCTKNRSTCQRLKEHFFDGLSLVQFHTGTIRDDSVGDILPSFGMPVFTKGNTTSKKHETYPRNTIRKANRVKCTECGRVSHLRRVQ